MKFLFILLYFSFISTFVSAEVGKTYSLRSSEFTYQNEGEKEKAESQALKMLQKSYQRFPDVDNCYAGKVTELEKRRALKELNLIRQAHGLEAVGYDETKDRFTTASALISSANRLLDHYPSSRLKCYSKDGYEGSRHSNMHLTSDYIVFLPENFAEKVIDELIIDDNVFSLGHRLWFLDPFLGDISYGRVTHVDNHQRVADAVSIYISNIRQNIINTKADYIAYPDKNYPSNWFTLDWFLHFSVIADKSSREKNITSVNYANASISVSSADGRTMRVHSIKYTDPNKDKDYMGLGNHIQWRVDGLQKNKKYSVKIKNAMINGTPKDYAYWFNITD